MAEIIDLTVSPQREIIEISSDQCNTPLTRDNRVQGERKRKRKKRRTPNGLSSDAPTNSSTQPSRAQSQEVASEPCESNDLALYAPSAPTPRRTTPPTADILFFFDKVAAPITEESTPLELGESNGDDSNLLLPSHVTIFHGDEPVSVIPPPKPSSDDEEYIEYLDYEDRKGPGLIRYFEVEEQASQSKTSTFKCKNCGAEGDHRSNDCPVQICLTCGARDEHSTRSCPISKTCYTCGMKGHINKTCPNRFSARAMPSGSHGDCDRCGSTGHKMNECPTLWRIYQYMNEEERNLIMQSREQKKRLAIGEGGEGYIGGEMWCYNCANTGHLGDDCDELPHPATFPTGYSAFSFHSIMSGPFYDPAAEPTPSKRGQRENAIDQHRLSDNWEESALVDVGRRGKNKDKERLEKRFREQEDKGEDWFNNTRNVRKRGVDHRQAPPPAPPRGRRLKFGMFKDERDERSSPPPSLQSNGGGLSLLARLGDASGRRNRKTDHREPSPQFDKSIRIRGAAAEQRKQEHRNSNQSNWDQGQENGNRPGSHRGSKRNHGPRFKGGYDR